MRFRSRVRMEHLKRFQGLCSDSQGRNPALTVLYVPSSLSSGRTEPFGLAASAYLGCRVWFWGSGFGSLEIQVFRFQIFQGFAGQRLGTRAPGVW